MTDSTTIDLVERLEASGAGEEQWRVANPVTGAYCISFCRSDGITINPERDAQRWLATQRENYPQGRFADYCVQRVVVQDERDMLMLEAAREIQRLRKRIDADDRAARSLNEALNTGDGSYRP